jgi:hypothetical protein
LLVYQQIIDNIVHVHCHCFNYTKHLVRFSIKINNLMICVYMHMMMCHSIKSVTYCIGYIQPNDTISLKFIFFCTKLFTLVNMIWIAINKNIWLVIKTMAISYIKRNTCSFSKERTFLHLGLYVIARYIDLKWPW